MDMDAQPTASNVPHLTQDQAAVHLNLSPRTLEKYRVIGGGPKFRKFGTRVRYTLNDLNEWSAARTCESTSDPLYTARPRPPAHAR
jgi:hypothetical protein